MTVAVVTRIMPEKRANAMQEANRMGMEKGMGCSIKGQASERPSETVNPQFLRYRNYSSTAALSTVSQLHPEGAKRKMRGDVGAKNRNSGSI